MAEEWLNNWSRLSDDDRSREPVNTTDIGEIATAHFNIHGASACADSLRQWTPPSIAYTVGRHLARRFVDHGRYKDLDELAIASGDNIYLVLAIVVELREQHRTPPKAVLKLCLRHLLNPDIEFETGNNLAARDSALNVISALVEACIALSVGSATALARLLTRYLPKEPPHGLRIAFQQRPCADPSRLCAACGAPRQDVDLARFGTSKSAERARE